MWVHSDSSRKEAAVTAIAVKCVPGWQQTCTVKSNPDPWRRIIFWFFFLTETKSHCNGFCSHRTKNTPLRGTKSFSSLFLAFHVASGCYTLNLRWAFFCGQSSCCVQSNHPHLDNGFDSCRRREEHFHPHMKGFSLGILFHPREFVPHMCFSAAVICILSLKCGGR